MSAPQTKVSKDWRCPNMRAHFSEVSRLAVPCADCYSVTIVETPVPLDLNTVQAHKYWVSWDRDLR